MVLVVEAHFVHTQMRLYDLMTLVQLWVRFMGIPFVYYSVKL